MKLKIKLFLPVLIIIALVLAACGHSATEDSTGKLKVVSAVSPITSIVENIGGTRIDLEGVVPEGVNSHTFEPAPSVAAVLSRADLVVLNGLFLEEPTLEMARANLKSGADILSLGDMTISRDDWLYDFSFPESDGHPNPHLWPDPMLALRYAELVRDALSSADPENAGYYSENLEKFEERIQDLDGRIKTAVDTVPPENRKLLTYHDSWAYFAKRYSMQVVGAAQPSDFAEPSSREVARLIDQVKEQRIPAIFGSEVFPSDILETIARESGAEYVDQLRDDDLPGGPGDPRHSYLGLMLQNMEIMISSLGGNTSALEGFDPGQVFEGNSGAKYPQ